MVAKLIEIKSKIKWVSVKPAAVIVALFGAGMLPCPDCGAPMIMHFWPVAVALLISNKIKKKLRKEIDAEISILQDEAGENHQ